MKPVDLLTILCRDSAAREEATATAAAFATAHNAATVRRADQEEHILTARAARVPESSVALLILLHYRQQLTAATEVAALAEAAAKAAKHAAKCADALATVAVLRHYEAR